MKDKTKAKTWTRYLGRCQSCKKEIELHLNDANKVNIILPPVITVCCQCNIPVRPVMCYYSS